MSIFASLQGVEFTSHGGTHLEDRLLAHFVRLGTHDGYEFYLPHDMVRSAGSGSAADSRVFRRIAELPARLAAADWDVLYAELAIGAYVRDAFARRPFPVVWRIDPLDPVRLEQQALCLLLSNVGSHDAIVHTSTAEQRAIERALDLAREEVRLATGRTIPFPARFVRIGPALDPVAEPRVERAGPPEGPTVALAGSSRPVAPDALLPLLNLWPTLPGNPRLVVSAREVTPEAARVLGELGPDGVSVREGSPLAGADAAIVLGETGLASRGRLLLQVQSLGIPVVAPDHSSCREFVLPGRTGFLVPVRPWCAAGDPEPRPLFDASALREALTALVGEPERRRAMGREARAWASREGDPERLARTFDELCRELAAACRTAPVALRRADRPGLALAASGFFDSFRWNYSEILEDGDRLETTALGERTLEGTHVPPVYAKLTPYVRGEVVADILGRSRSGATLGSIAEAVGDAEVAAFHTLWMLKHGLLARPARRGPCEGRATR